MLEKTEGVIKKNRQPSHRYDELPYHVHMYLLYYRQLLFHVPIHRSSKYQNYLQI